jgi:hypothetical protein
MKLVGARGCNGLIFHTMSKVDDKLPFFAGGTSTKNKSILFNGSKREIQRKFRQDRK